MFHKSLLIAFVMLAQVLYAQPLNLKTASTVSTIAYFEVGTMRRYQVTDTEEKFKGKETSPSESTVNSYELLIKVIEVTDNYLVLDMIYRLPDKAPISKKRKKNDVFTQQINAVYEKLARLNNNMTVRYRTDELGTFDTILNLKELGEKMGASFDLITQEFKKAIESMDVDDEKRQQGMALFDKIFGNMRELYTKPEHVELLYLDDIMSLHSAYGMELTLNKTEELEIIYPLFNDHTVNGKGKITLTNINKPSDEFRFDVVQEPDQEELKAVLADFISTILPEEMSEEIDVSKYKMSSTTKESYTMSLSTGWVRKLSIVSKSKLTTTEETIKTNRKVEYLIL